MPSARLALALFLLLASCGHPFHARYERELRDADASALTAVEAHYLAEGEHIELAGQSFQVQDGQLVGTEAQPVPAGQPIPLPGSRRFVVAAAQEAQWRLLVHDPDAPARREFHGLRWFPKRLRYVVLAHYEPDPERPGRSLLTSRGLSKTLYRAGVFTFELGGREHRLVAFGYSPEPQPDEPLLIPFKDATTGHQTYGAGRYLERPAPPTDRTLLDFNRATNPLCAYSPHYNCPLTPPENRLDVAIRAGERTPPGH